MPRKTCGKRMGYMGAMIENWIVVSWMIRAKDFDSGANVDSEEL